MNVNFWAGHPQRASEHSPMSHWETSVDELLGLFRDAMSALIPIAERAHMPWKEPQAYDDWDAICRAIYRSIVIGSMEHAAGIGTSMPLPDYDLRTSSYEKSSFIGNAASKERAAFVCFETERFPFDRCLFAVLDSNSKVVSKRQILTADTHFSFFVAAMTMER
jgi:hypothetical protein